MKNLHIKIGEVVPVDLRIEIYKEAIEIIEKGEQVFGLQRPWLCMMMPYLLWGSDVEFEKWWTSIKCSQMFPEITPYFIIKMDAMMYSDEKNAIRIAHLKHSIEQLTK